MKIKKDTAKMIGIVLLAVFIISFAIAQPDGPTVEHINNETGVPSPADSVNITGGSITTLVLNGTTQNVRWKAFIGNVTGSLTLDDAAGHTVYDWSLTTISGEVYATRNSSQINWINISCANITHLENENYNLNHTSVDDNISATFNSLTHEEFYVGTVQIQANSCYSLYTYVNDSAQSSDFAESVLYDGVEANSGNIVYSSILEQDKFGYNNLTYDFQMIVPEKGEPTWTGDTPYYFYLELS